MKLTWILIVSVLLAVAFAGNIYPASPYKFNDNVSEIMNQAAVKPSDCHRILLPDGRVQIVNYRGNKNGYAKHEPSSYTAEARFLTTSRPDITTTSAPGWTGYAFLKDLTVPVSVNPAFEKQSPLMPIPYTVPISFTTPIYSQAFDLPISSPYDDPTYVTSNVDLSTLFRETASRKFLRL